MTDTELQRRKAICEIAHVNDIGELSDGSHTFNGLYHQRAVLFAALVKAYRSKSWKSYRHDDGEYCFGGGWFIVGIDTPEGPYTYHYENRYWDMFDCVDLPRAPKWDGHTEDDAETRLLSLPAMCSKMPGEYEITIEKLLKIVHSYTDPIRICVVMGDAWLTCEEAKHMRNFDLVNHYRSSGLEEDQNTEKRLLKYYKDCPVWNLTVWIDGPDFSVKGRQLVLGIEARCHYKDIRDGWLAEQADIKREKQREYRKRKREKKED